MEDITLSAVLQAAVAFFQSHAEIVAFGLAVLVVSIVVAMVEIVMDKAVR